MPTKTPALSYFEFSSLADIAATMGPRPTGLMLRAEPVQTMRRAVVEAPARARAARMSIVPGRTVLR